jgi:hypothetical protein
MVSKSRHVKRGRYQKRPISCVASVSIVIFWKCQAYNTNQPFKRMVVGRGHLFTPTTYCSLLCCRFEEKLWMNVLNLFFKFYFSTEKAGCTIKIVVGVWNKVQSRGPLQGDGAIEAPMRSLLMAPIKIPNLPCWGSLGGVKGKIQLCVFWGFWVSYYGASGWQAFNGVTCFLLEATKNEVTLDKW